MLSGIFFNNPACGAEDFTLDIDTLPQQDLLQYYFRQYPVNLLYDYFKEDRTLSLITTVEEGSQFWGIGSKLLAVGG
jgi:hypothetical protein